MSAVDWWRSRQVLHRGQAQVVQPGRHVAVALAREVLRTAAEQRVSATIVRFTLAQQRSCLERGNAENCSYLQTEQLGWGSD